MIQEFVRIKSNDNIEMCGMLYKPEHETKKVVIHIHGLAGNFYRGRYLDYLAKMYTNLGYAFFSFNNRGYEYTSYLLKETDKLEYVPGGGSAEIFEKCIFDIDGATKYLDNLGYDEYILEGHSFGCNKVSYYYANIEDKSLKAKIKKLILLAPCDVVMTIKNEFKEYILTYKEECEKKIIEGKAKDMVINKHAPLSSFTARTYINNFTEEKNADIFRYREDSFKSNVLNKIDKQVICVIGDEDNSSITQEKSKINEFLSQNISKLKLEYIPGADHSYLNHENDLANIIKELI